MIRLLPLAAALLFAPLLLGVINRTKAFVAGRTGQPLLQLYFDLFRLLHKGAVYSRTTTWVFRAGPVISLAAVIVALALVPLGATPALLAFPGDFLLLVGLLVLARAATTLAALDTGSSFEGMGASRELFFAALAEPGLLLSFAAIARASGDLSLTGMLSSHSLVRLVLEPHLYGLVGAAVFILILVENARVPVDDPNTHLELTMIHEVMVLDHSGPDFAMILYGAALKLWLFAALFVGLVLPVRSEILAADLVVTIAAVGATAVAIGVVESVMARLRLLRIPQFIVAAAVFSAIALGLMLR